MAYDLSDYVDVPERIRAFAAKYPEGSLQSRLEWKSEAGGWLCRAYAYRNQDDKRPGVGHAFEPVPGKTPYTKDSEAQNAETSAWGRAIVALGFETKKIASANEVRAREPKFTAPNIPKVEIAKASDAQRKRLGELRLSEEIEWTPKLAKAADEELAKPHLTYERAAEIISGLEKLVGVKA